MDFKFSTSGTSSSDAPPVTREEVAEMIRAAIPSALRRVDEPAGNRPPSSPSPGWVLTYPDMRGQFGDPTAVWAEPAGAGAGTGMDYSDFSFGFSLASPVVTVMAGKVRQGTRDPVAYAGGTINPAADKTWTYIAFPFGGATATLMQSLTEPKHTATTLNWPLARWDMTEGVITLNRICWLGDIIIPGNFA